MKHLHLAVWLTAFFAMLFGSCHSGNTAPGQKQDMGTPPQTRDTVAARKPEKVDSLPVVSLPTSDGASESDSLITDYEYPANVAVPGADSFRDQLAAYGAAYEVWVAPKGWTGLGDKGADGNTVAHLHPANGNDSVGPHITYYAIPACQGCILWSAAQYFANARKDYDEEFNNDHSSDINPPAGITMTQLSPRLVVWSLPDTNGLLRKGVAYYSDEGDPFYTEASFYLPTNQDKVAEFLVRNFIRYTMALE